MTSEGESQTEAWVEDKGAAFPFAYDPGSKLFRALGASGYPSAYLVDPTGKVVWQGHPSSLDAATIEQHLEGALTRPIYTWSGAAGKVKKAFLKNDFGGAITAAKKLAEDDPFGVEVEGIVRGILEGRLAMYDGALERGDVLTAYDGYKSLSKGLKGLDEDEHVKAQLKVISKSKEMKAAMKAQEDLAEISAVELRRKKDCDEVVDALEKLLKKNEDGFVGEAIRAKIKDVKQLKGRMSY